jgi:branched-chain amino acid transport system permease protein
MNLFLISVVDGLVTGLLLFMLSSGLTLIFSMMGVLNFAHASFYMLGAYLGYSISVHAGFVTGILVAPPVIGILGAVVERYGLRNVHKYGHVSELVFTFGLAMLIEEVVQFIWGRGQLPYQSPEFLNFALVNIAGNTIPAYKIFMIFVSIGVFSVLLYVLQRTRLGIIIQASLSHPETVQSLGHNVPLVLTIAFGVGTALAGLAGVIAGPIVGTHPGMALATGTILFVTIIVGGLGSLFGALLASLMIGWIMTFAVASNVGFVDIARALGIDPPSDITASALRDVWTLTLAQLGPVIPYLLMVLILIFRPNGLFGKRIS